MPNPLHPTGDQDSTSESDLDQQRKSARDEASARSTGAQRRYRLDMLETIDARVRQRRRQNFLRSSKVRTVIGAMTVLAASVLILQHKHIAQEKLHLVFTQGTLWLAEFRGIKAEGQHARPGPAEIPLEAVTRPVRTDDLLPLPHSPAPAAEADAMLLASTKQRHADESSLPAKKVAVASAPVMPTPIPGAPLESIVTMAARQEVAKAPPTSDRQSPKQVKPVARQAITTSSEEVEEPPIASELELAVANARQKLGADTKQKQHSKPATGVFVDLPKQPASGQALTPKDARQSSPVQTHESFTLVQAFEGGILVRTGRSVSPYRIGDTLPNGKKLVSVDTSAGTFRAVESVAPANAVPVQGQ